MTARDREAAQAWISSSSLAASACVAMLPPPDQRPHGRPPPCQALADLAHHARALRAAQRRGGRLVEEGNNVADSLMEAGAVATMDVRIACPRGREPDPVVLAGAEISARENGGRVEVVHDPCEAVEGAHAVYTDVWVSMGDEVDAARRHAELEPYRVDGRLMAHAGPTRSSSTACPRTAARRSPPR